MTKDTEPGSDGPSAASSLFTGGEFLVADAAASSCCGRRFGGTGPGTTPRFAEVLAEMTPEESAVAADSARPSAGDSVASACAGAERQVIGVLTVPNGQRGTGTEVLPQVYRDIMEVVADAPGPVRAKQIVPRIGLPAETGKIEGTRWKLKRLVERGWLDEDVPGLFTLARRRGGASPNSR
ncbi:hypothetical protein [Streptomyces sp. NPDC090994]|uniref:hypothetical protein n=1 Tax=Streptomyces sp. NPDC090994 TaxID=3365969 RepID=UPI00380B8F01